MSDSTKSYNDGLMDGFFVGLIVMIIIGLIVIDPPQKALKKFSLSHGLAHYDSKTGEYVQDSIVKINDSTIKVK